MVPSSCAGYSGGRWRASCGGREQRPNAVKQIRFLATRRAPVRQSGGERSSMSSIGVVREARPGETRVSATPNTVGQLVKLGYEVIVESGAGELSSFPDEAYVEAGATVGDPLSADIVFGVNAQSKEQLDGLKEGATVI